MDTKSACHQDLADGEGSIYIIERLIQIGYSPKEAEELVDEWTEQLTQALSRT